MKVANGKRQWLTNVTAYTLAGGLASLSVGASLAWLGGLLPQRATVVVAAAAIIVALVAMARDLGWVRLSLPQSTRQTKRTWGMVLPGPVAAALWGLDLGLTFMTRLTFSGAWFLAFTAAVAGRPRFGATLFVAYWAGRAMSVWFAPFLLPDANATPSLLNEILERYRVFRGIHVVGLAWAVVALTSSLALGLPM